MNADSGSFQYEYDALNRLTQVSRDGSLLRKYAYDAFGNRTVKEDYSGQTMTQTTYRYNANNQMVSRVNEEEQTYTYDHRGNLTAVSRGEEQFKAFTFDAANRMHSAFEIKDGIGTRAEYTYNAFGNRVGQDIYSIEPGNSVPEMAGQKPQNPEQQIYYTIDLTRQYHNLLVSEDKAEQKEQTFYWDGNVAAMEENERDSYYLQDDLGSPMQLVDEEGKIRETYGFDEFGLNINHYPEKQIQPFGYTGYQMEVAGGLYFAQARRYDAGTGRFVSEDRVKGNAYIPITINTYLYCRNHPMKYIDPSGNVYIIAWSYSRSDAEDFEKWYSKKHNINTITIDGDTSDWSDEMWKEWDQRSSFARAANTKENELIAQGVSPDDIICERIDNADDFIDAWSEWQAYDSVQQMHIYSHGYAGTPEVYGGTRGNISDLEQYPKLNWISDDITFEAASYFYGCHTAEGNNLQTYANNQGVITYGNRYSASFSSKKDKKKRIKTYETDGNVYLGVYGVYTEEGFDFYCQWIFNKIYAVQVPMTKFIPEDECIE